MRKTLPAATRRPEHIAGVRRPRSGRFFDCKL